MTRIKQAGPPVLIVALIAGLVGYIIGCTRAQRERDAQALAQDTAATNDDGQKADQSAGEQPAAAVPTAPVYSPVKARARDFYAPNTEDLGPNEMRLIACGTGMPTARPKQAASCWLLELGNGDKFLFDVGTGSNERIAGISDSLQLPRQGLPEPLAYWTTSVIWTRCLSAAHWAAARNRCAFGDRAADAGKRHEVRAGSLDESADLGPRRP